MKINFINFMGSNFVVIIVTIEKAIKMLPDFTI